LVKLPDPTALGAGPNFRQGGTAQVDDRVLYRGVRDIREGGLAIAEAINRGGSAISRSMALAGDAAARAAGGQADIGRAVSRSGAEMADAIARGGARQGDAVTRAGALQSAALERGGEVISGAMRRGGEAMADATRAAGAVQAKGLRDLGAGLQDVAKTAIEMQLANDQLDFAQRKTQWQIDQSNLDQKYERDRDYGTLSQRYEAELGARRAQLADGITNPAFKRRFEMETALGATQSINRQKDRAFNVEADANRAELETKLTELQAAATRETDDRARGEKLIDGQRYIDAAERKGYLSAEKAQNARTQWAQNYSIAWVESLPADTRLDLLRERPQGREATIDRIIQVESGGRATARARTSSAFGAGQFVEGTWISLVGKHRPDLLEGRSRAEVLALRADPQLSREMVGHLYDDNDEFLRSKGIVPTPTNLYMAHFLGAQGAVDVLTASPDTPLAQVLTQRNEKAGKKAIEANPELLGRGTTGQLIAKIERKMGSVRGTGTPIDFIPENQRQKLEKAAETAVLQERSARDTAMIEQFKFKINEMEHGRIPVFGRDEILRSGLPLKEGINPLMEKYDAAMKKQEDFTLVQRLVDNKLPVNGWDDKQVAGVDLMYRRRLQSGVDPAAEALNVMRDTSGVLPKTAAVELKAGILSTDPKRVEAAAEFGSQALDINEHVFARDEKTAQAVTKYRYYRDELRYSPAQAAQMVISSNAPEFKKELDIRRKDENVKQSIAKVTSEADLRNALGESTWFTLSAGVGSDDATKAGLLRDWRSLTEEHFYTNAKDIEEAKNQAAEQLKRGGWGVTKVNGSSTVVRFAPERSPVYQGIDNVSDRIAKQAIADIKTATGKDVDRSKIRLDYIPRTTAQSWDANEPPRYRLWYEDPKTQRWHPLMQDFAADPNVMRSDISAELTRNQAASKATQATMNAIPTVGAP
jgi:hypothetical protein